MVEQRVALMVDEKVWPSAELKAAGKGWNSAAEKALSWAVWSADAKAEKMAGKLVSQKVGLKVERRAEMMVVVMALMMAVPMADLKAVRKAVLMELYWVEKKGKMWVGLLEYSKEQSSVVKKVGTMVWSMVE